MTNESEAQSPDQSVLNLDYLAGTMGYQVGRVRQLYMRLFARHFDALGITPAQFATLVAIEDNPGTSQANLCAVLETDPSRMVAIIDEFEARGLAVRSPSPNDRRTRVVSLTADGRKALAESKKMVEVLEAEFAGDLSPEEQRQLVGLLKRLGG